MSNADDAMQIMREMIDEVGLLYSAEIGETRCQCGRLMSGRGQRCNLCLSKALKEFCGEFQADRFLLNLTALARSKTGVIHCASTGERL